MQQRQMQMQMSSSRGRMNTKHPMEFNKWLQENGFYPTPCNTFMIERDKLYNLFLEYKHDLKKS